MHKMLVCDIKFGVWQDGNVPKISYPFSFLIVNLDSCSGQILPLVFENLNAEDGILILLPARFLQPPTQPDNSVIALLP
jgi:hypothetical protein